MKYIYEKTRELSDLFMDTVEMKQYLKALDQLEEDADISQLLKDKKQLESQAIRGEQLEQEDLMLALQNLELEIEKTPLLQEIRHLEKEMKAMIKMVTSMLEFSLPEPLFSTSSSGCSKKTGSCCAARS